MTHKLERNVNAKLCYAVSCCVSVMKKMLINDSFTNTLELHKYSDIVAAFSYCNSHLNEPIELTERQRER